MSSAEQKMKFTCDAEIDKEGPFPREARFIIRVSLPDEDVASHVTENGEGWAMMFLNVLGDAIKLHERQTSKLPEAYK